MRLHAKTPALAALPIRKIKPYTHKGKVLSNNDEVAFAKWCARKIFQKRALHHVLIEVLQNRELRRTKRFLWKRTGSSRMLEEEPKLWRIVRTEE